MKHQTCFSETAVCDPEAEISDGRDDNKTLLLKVEHMQQ